MLKKTPVITAMFLAVCVSVLPRCDTAETENSQDIPIEENAHSEISSFVAAAGDTEVVFAWEVPTDFPVAGFLLSYRFESAGPPWTHQTIVTQNSSWTLSPAINNTPVFAVVQAIAANGEPGIPSQIAEATPTQQIGSQAYIPPGSFTMGWTPGLHHFDEEPAHEAWLDGYWIDRYPVTVGQWMQCVQEGGCNEIEWERVLTDPLGSIDDVQEVDAVQNHPMVGLTYEDALSICSWRGMTLPTEAQWEKAARGPGPDLYPYPWGGEAPTCETAGYAVDEISCTEGTLPVGSYPNATSPYGVHDLSGVVWQWTSDWYHPEAYQNHLLYNPAGPSSGEAHVLRGGAWNSVPATLFTTARREGIMPLDTANIGTRCVRPAL